MTSADEQAAAALAHKFYEITKRRGLCSGDITLARRYLDNFCEARERSQLRDAIFNLEMEFGPRQRQNQSYRSEDDSGDSIACLDKTLWCAVNSAYSVCDPGMQAQRQHNNWNSCRTNANKEASILLETVKAYALSLTVQSCTVLESTKVHEGLLKERLKQVRRSTSSKCISSQSLKLWLNAAALHVCLLIRMARGRSCNWERMRDAAREYQAALDELLICYEVYRKHSVRVYTIKGLISNYGIRLHDYESGKVTLRWPTDVERRCAVHNPTRIADKYVDFIIESDFDSQVLSIKQFFEEMLTRVHNPA